VAGLRQRVKLQTGSLATEIVLPDMEGNNISLSSLKGKYVLLCFWASWSPESIEQINMLELIKSRRYIDEPVIYQVSLDRTRESWVNSIETENFSGIQVSDLNYWDSPLVWLYQIESLPLFFLIDREGRIAARDFNASEFEQIFSSLP